MFSRAVSRVILSVASLSASIHGSPLTTRQSSQQDISLESFALQKVLQNAAPIFGNFKTTQSNTSDWMKNYKDATKLVHMNIPGTHDTATWNYSTATQNALMGITNLGGEVPSPAEYYRCQESSIDDMLNAGIRAFDLRFALDVTNTTLVFWHSRALQSQTATMEDVLFGYYHWLDEHPSEVLFLSFQYEGSTTAYGSNDAEAQLKVFDVLTSAAAKQYFLQTQNELGALGEARGKIILLRRFDLDQLPESYSSALPGLHFSPALWTDNSPDISILYNEKQNSTAYIEDYYEPDAPIGSNATLNIEWKYNATTSHLLKATTQYPDSLFWTFASSEHNLNLPADTPKIMATGNGTEYTPSGGVNQKLVPFLRRLKGKRVGIVMFDFFETPGELVHTFLSL
jgi:1-phosphatidylinositol phosphodiesterase